MTGKVIEQEGLVPFQQTGAFLPTADPAAIAAAESAKARIQSAYLMALHKPRDPEKSKARILAAVANPAMAERVEYAKPIRAKNKDTGEYETQYLQGPSIRFAEMAIQNWGNLMVDTQVLYEDMNSRRVRVNVIDLESNAQFGRDVQIAKTVERQKPPKDRFVVNKRTNSGGEITFIVAATDDEIQIKEAAAVSKVIRNEGLRLIPSDIIDEALATARKALEDERKRDKGGALKKMVDAFAALKVSQVDLEGYIKHPLVDLAPDEFATLRGIYSTIQSGEAKWADYLETPDEGKGPAGKTAEERLKETLKA